MAKATFRLNPSLAVYPTAWSAQWTIAGTFYGVQGTWDNRATDGAGAWRLSWFKSDGSRIISGRKLVLTDDHFALFHHLPDIPPGRLQVRRADGGEADPGLYDLASAIVFEYITE